MMKPSVEVAGARVFLGDCRDVLRSLPDNSVDSVVTDPPYELGFMGKKWDSSGIAYDVTVWEECLRVLKPGGHLLAFGGSRTYHRLGVAIEDAGFEIRDTIAWISSKTFPKSLNVSKAIDKKLGAERQVVGVRSVPDQRGGKINSQDTIASGGVKQREVFVTESATPEAQKWEGWGTGLKQVVEPVVLARKPLDGTVAENTLAWGVGGLNIDGSRIASNDGFEKAWDKPVMTNIGAVPQNFGIGIGDGISHSVDLSGNRPVGGRWPANVILDEVSAGLLDEQSGESPSRFFYQAKASKRDRNEGLEHIEPQKKYKSGGTGGTGGAKDAHQVANQKPMSNFHPTVKPTQLMRYLINLVTPAGGTVLDPFTGSGSTGKAALLDGFDFVGAELTEEYLPIIEGRLKWASEQGEETDDTLF